MVNIPPEWLDETNTEIAKRLKVSVSAILYARRRMNGQSERCGKPAVPGLRHCRRQLKAHLRPEVKCNAICTGARGHVCDCSCGGKNHGIAA
jgi:hypothetical protein